MHLDVRSIAVKDVNFGPRTVLEGRTLVLHRDEIRHMILEDPHFADVEVHLAKPGEPVRIIHALDIVEPRWKVAGPGGVFPGFVSPPSTVGDGKTNRLAGVAVVDVGAPVPGEPTHFREGIIDMFGPGARYSPFARTLNIVLHFIPNLAFFPPDAVESKNILGGGTAAVEYNRAIVSAGTRVAAYLGRTSVDLQPDEVETFELHDCDPQLPRIACIYQHMPTTLYGIPVSLPLGTVIHPNECFDGALIGDFGSATYLEQNNEVMRQLCRRHGSDVNFVGCILFGCESPYREEKERTASAAAKLAHVLRAQGALVLGINGTNFAVDCMLAIQECERIGIKTTLLYFDMGYGPDDAGFVFTVPEADAVVSTGSRDLTVTLPRPERVIGGDRLVDPDLDPAGEISIILRHIHGAHGVQGHNYFTTRFQ